MSHRDELLSVGAPVLDLADLPALIHCPAAAIVPRSPVYDDKNRRLRDWLRDGDGHDLGTRDDDREVLRAIVASRWSPPAGVRALQIACLADGRVLSWDESLTPYARGEIAFLWTDFGEITVWPPRIPVGGLLHVLYPTMSVSRDTHRISRYHATLAAMWGGAKRARPVIWAPPEPPLLGDVLEGIDLRMEELALRGHFARGIASLVEPEYFPGEWCRACVGIITCPRVAELVKTHGDIPALRALRESLRGL